MMRQNTIKLLVITDPEGKLIGTQEVSQETPNHLVKASIKAGPGQLSHEIELTHPKSNLAELEITEFHRLVQEHLDQRQSIEQAS